MSVAAQRPQHSIQRFPGDGTPACIVEPKIGFDAGRLPDPVAVGGAFEALEQPFYRVVVRPFVVCHRRWLSASSPSGMVADRASDANRRAA